MLLLSSADFFPKLTFPKNSVMNTIRISNGLDSDQDQRSFGLDLGPNCSQTTKVAPNNERVKMAEYLSRHPDKNV